MKTKKLSREVAFAIVMSSILNVSVAELGSTYAEFVNDFYQEGRV